jgi:hypothetical protein
MRPRCRLGQRVAPRKPGPPERDAEGRLDDRLTDDPESVGTTADEVFRVLMMRDTLCPAMPRWPSMLVCVASGRQ